MQNRTIRKSQKQSQKSKGFENHTGWYRKERMLNTDYYKGQVYRADQDYKENLCEAIMVKRDTKIRGYGLRVYSQVFK